MPFAPAVIATRNPVRSTGSGVVAPVTMVFLRWPGGMVEEFAAPCTSDR
jgi:hypothetical protein